MTSKSIDRRPQVEVALVIHPIRPRETSLRTPDARLEEAVGLAQALDLDIRQGLIAPLRTVTVGPDGSLIRGVAGRWFVTDLDLGPDIAAALVLEGRRSPSIAIERLDPAVVGLPDHRA